MEEPQWGDIIVARVPIAIGTTPGLKCRIMILIFWPVPFQSIKNVSPKTGGVDWEILLISERSERKQTLVLMY